MPTEGSSSENWIELKKIVRRCSDLIDSNRVDETDLARVVILLEDGIYSHKYEIIPGLGRYTLNIEIEGVIKQYKPFILKKPSSGQLLPKCKVCDWLLKKFRMSFKEYCIEPPQKLSIIYYNLIRDDFGVLPEEDEVQDMVIDTGVLTMQQRQDVIDYKNFYVVYNYLVNKFETKLREYFSNHPSLAGVDFFNPLDRVDYFIRW